MNLKILIPLILFGLSIKAQIINFSDADFKNALLNHYPIVDTNGDGEIQISEANNYAYPLYLGTKNIHDLTGFEYFINTPSLICNNNFLTFIDISHNVNLSTLICDANQLTTIDTSQNINLSYLSCTDNNLTNLDLSKTAMNYLDCSYNNINTLQLPNSIFELWCEDNNLTYLNVSNHTNLRFLFCGGNVNLLNININGCNIGQLSFEYTQISSLDLTGNTNMQSLEVPGNELTSLDVSNLPNLQQLYCGGNHISILDVTNNPLLLALGVSSNNLDELDVSNNSYLDMLWCHTNNISTLDLSSNSHLTDLNCYSDNLENLDVRNGNNINVTRFIAWNSPNLSCIYVDDATFSQANWINVDDTVNFVETESECEALSTNQNVLDSNLVVYPNPVVDYLYIDNINDIKNIIVYNTLGQELIKTNNNTIDFSNYKEGVYLVTINTINGKTINRKIIKK